MFRAGDCPRSNSVNEVLGSCLPPTATHSSSCSRHRQPRTSISRKRRQTQQALGKRQNRGRVWSNRTGVSGVQRHGIREAERRSWSKVRRRRGNCRGTDSGPEPEVQGTTRVFAISAYWVDAAIREEDKPLSWPQGMWPVSLGTGQEPANAGREAQVKVGLEA